MNGESAKNVTVEVVRDGPYQVSGKLPLTTQTIGTDASGQSVRWLAGPAISTPDRYALCRCGQSASKPFCDGSHAKVGFDGTETASRESYENQAKVIPGPTLTLRDAESLCAFARFCDPNGQVWNLVSETDRPESRKHFLQEVSDCPSGRLVAWDNATRRTIEPFHEPSIGLIEDPAKACSGPVWLRGGVQVVGADGFKYEIRNRVTLCRCGASRNKPYCDGTHAAPGSQGS